jgi:hypothetical protein
MSSAPTPDEIWKDARWLAQAVDPRAGLVRLVEMSPEAYREASFLDDRMFQQKQRTSHLLPWGNVASSMPAGARRDARWIFHISHVGSTLIARLLGELDGILSVREPRALRDLTFFPPDVRARFIPTIQALFSRTFAPNGAALIKATSFVGELAGELLPDGQQALFLYATPRSFMSGILAGENSRKELSGRSEQRAARLASRGVNLPAPRSEADLAAAAWACEMVALEAADGANVRWADFDRVLDDMPGFLEDLAGFFAFEASAERLAEISNGPLMRRYSKATEYEYSPELRRELLAEAEATHRSDIESALAMLDAASETAPLLRKALDRAQAES